RVAELLGGGCRRVVLGCVVGRAVVAVIVMIVVVVAVVVVVVVSVVVVVAVDVAVDRAAGTGDLAAGRRVVTVVVAAVVVGLGHGWHRGEGEQRDDRRHGGLAEARHGDVGRHDGAGGEGEE